MLFLFFNLFFNTFGWTQSTVYRNPIDDGLTIKSVAVAPFVDNVDGIYSRPLTEVIQQIIKNDKQWDVRKWIDEKPIKPEDLEDKPEQVKFFQKKNQVDGILSARISKSSNGITVRFDLFVGPDGYLIAQEILSNYDRFEIDDLKIQLIEMFKKLKKKLPYQGLILSRKNQFVTFNLGASNDIQVGDPISVIQIVKIQRHPKLRFLVSSEKEILGRILVTKIDGSLSFGTIEMEREPNILSSGMKIQPINFVKLPTGPNEINEKHEPVAFGNNPKEWQSHNSPTFGKIGLLFGLGNYNLTNTLSTAGGIEDNKILVPSMHFRGEMWMTQKWFLGLGLKQYVFSVSNTLANSTPSTLNITSLQSDLAVGYNFLMTERFFGPKFQFTLGYSKFTSSVDSSTPLAYTSMNFNGINLGIGGATFIDEDEFFEMGGRLNYYLFPTVDESPVSSGESSSATISGFTVFGNYKWTEYLRLNGEVLYDLFSASFSGAGTRFQSASSASHNIFTLAFGIEYLF